MKILCVMLMLLISSPAFAFDASSNYYSSNKSYVTCQPKKPMRWPMTKEERCKANDAYLEQVFKDEEAKKGEVR